MNHRINLVWPTWARVASRIPAELANLTAATWALIVRTARLSVHQLELEQEARQVPEGHQHIWRGPLWHHGSGLIAKCVTCPVRTYVRRSSRASLSPFFLRRRRRVFGTLLVLALVVAASPGAAEEKREEESALFRAMGIATYAVFAGDLGSTELGLSTGRGYEANPFMQNRYARIGSHVVMPVAVNHVTAKLYQRGEKKKALWFRIAVVAGYGYLTAHNLREWNKVR